MEIILEDLRDCCEKQLERMARLKHHGDRQKRYNEAIWTKEFWQSTYPEYAEEIQLVWEACWYRRFEMALG